MLFVATVTAPLSGLSESYVVDAVDRESADRLCRAGIAAWCGSHGTDYARFKLYGLSSTGKARILASGHAWTNAPEGIRWHS